MAKMVLSVNGSINGGARIMVLSVAYKRYAFRSSGTRWQEKLWQLGTSRLHEGVENYPWAASTRNNSMPASGAGYILGLFLVLAARG